ncbi:MAG: helix-turn-helix domain-containing protein [Henriciella sp.]|nr:helix-turn-helix domain-containing protein [Henriciella sp.]
MRTKSFSTMQCSIARTLEHVGSWWSLLIIRDAMMGARRFKHFQRSLGIARNTLTNRLNDLVDAGILAKGPAANGSKHEEYVLTERGRELAPVIIALSQWGDKWVAHDNGPSTEITVKATGERLPRIWPRRETGEPMQLSEVGMRRNENAPPIDWSNSEEDKS